MEHTVSACEEDSNKVNIRIVNESNYDYCNLVMNPGSRTKNFGSINSGKNTCYIAFDEAYDYGYIQLFINNKEFVIQPIDYVGEEPLTNGYYTYKINVQDFENRKLSEEMIQDN